MAGRQRLDGELVEVGDRRGGGPQPDSTRVARADIAGLDLSSGARAGLTAFLKGVSQGVAGSNVTINNILPGSFDTDRLRSGQKRTAEQSGKDIAQVREEAAAKIPARRFGTPEEFGAACAFLCSTQAGYITGQNLLIDGGAFAGAF